MDTNQSPDKLQQSRDLKSQSIDGLKQLCENFAKARSVIDAYTEQYQSSATYTE